MRQRLAFVQLKVREEFQTTGRRSESEKGSGKAGALTTAGRAHSRKFRLASVDCDSKVTRQNWEISLNKKVLFYLPRDKVVRIAL